MGSLTAAADGLLRRKPTDVELASRVDFADMNAAWRRAVDDTVEQWARIQARQREEITAAVQAAVDAGDIDRLTTTTVSTTEGANLLFGRMQMFALAAGEAQQREAEAQGVDVPEWSLDDEALTAAAVRDRLRQVATTTSRLLGLGLVQSAVRQSVRLFGSGTGEQVAAQVDEHLAGLSGAQVEEQVGAAMTAAQNEGRMAVLAVAPPAEYTATEALDRNSCQACRDVDGTRYTNLLDARAAYPTGGYAGCLGGPRCRGTLVTVWPQGTGQPTTGMIMAVSGDTMPPNNEEGGGTVPYRIEQGHPDCGADTPWAVVKEGTGELMGCHASQVEAQRQQAALYAEEDDMPGDDMRQRRPAAAAEPPGMDYTGDTAPWEGLLAIEGITTGDGREFAPGALTWADLPVPLRWNIEDSHGGEPHTVAVNVGRIDRIWRDDEGKIMGAGVLDLGDDQGRRAHAKIAGGFLRGVSIDADSITDAETEMIWPDDVNEGMDEDLLEMLFAQPEKVIFHAGRIRAATLVDIPAFAEAYVALLDEAGAVVAGGQPAAELLAELNMGAVTAASPAAHPAMDGLWRPPAEWFADPQLPFYAGIIVTDEGRLYGHVAPWGACHIGYDGQCIQVPREDEHSHYMTGETVCADGTRTAVGQITVGTGHAELHLGAQPAKEHYDHTGTVVADVTVGNDKHGIWLAGAVRPTADPLSVYELRASGRVSGDWRRIGGKLRLVGLLGVNVAGFLQESKMRAVMASGQPQALVAAGVPRQRFSMSPGELDRWAVRRVMRMWSRQIHPEGGDR